MLETVLFKNWEIVVYEDLVVIWYWATKQNFIISITNVVNNNNTRTAIQQAFSFRAELDLK
jgi:hypothetical protein